ncbi:MAG: NAD-dependent epimerase/dehydratase family protein [Acidobacteria bacterium]|nr:NAD-dependent epimerase/dehydratase family protein [Acidobacteriota bacterium]
MNILVAGAAGALGRFVVAELRRRGHWVRALSRRGGVAEADETVVADALAGGVMGTAGVDVVFSCLGQTVSAQLAPRGPGYRQVDIPANLNLLAAARRSGVGRFVYVSVLRAEEYPSNAYLDAHARVARAVASSGLSHGIVAPTGFFSAYRPLLDMARKGQTVVFGGGEARSNPIAEEDLAEVCAEACESRAEGVVEAGGPEVVTRREMAELACLAAGEPVRVRNLPLWAPTAMSGLARPFAPRMADLMAFVRVVSGSDFVAPVRGTRRLGEYLRAEAKKTA